MCYGDFGNSELCANHGFTPSPLRRAEDAVQTKMWDLVPMGTQGMSPKMAAWWLLPLGFPLKPLFLQESLFW